MAIKQKEYLFSINDFKEPETVTGKKAIATLIIRLILMDKYTDPLRPLMGVGIRNYRYKMNSLDEIKAEIKSQMDTYLPCFPNANVDLIMTPDKVLNIEISIEDAVFIYDSAKAGDPIKLSDIESK